MAMLIFKGKPGQVMRSLSLLIEKCGGDTIIGKLAGEVRC